MTSHRIAVVGIGEDGLDGLTPVARRLIDDAEVIIGGGRHLALLPKDGHHPKRRQMTWASPLKKTIKAIAQLRGKRICVLATGDPMHYGIGVTLAREFPGQVTIIPHLSAFSLATARLGWPLASVSQITLHGRPAALLNRHLRPGARLLILADDGDTPQTVAQLLRQAGYGDSRLTVFEHMAGDNEKCFTAIANRWRRRVRPFNTIAVECISELAALPVTGLPDDAYRHDGQLTKQAVRAITMSALVPTPDALLWDVGAGAGSIAIEWLRQDASARAIAIERLASRRDCIRENADRLGVPNIEIIAGDAPLALKGLPRPDAVFVGGGVSTPGLIALCWRSLKTGGRLLANAVTIEGEAALLKQQTRHGGTLRRVSVAQQAPIGKTKSLHIWREAPAVVQYQGDKP